MHHYILPWPKSELFHRNKEVQRVISKAVQHFHNKYFVRYASQSLASGKLWQITFKPQHVMFPCLAIQSLASCKLLKKNLHKNSRTSLTNGDIFQLTIYYFRISPHDVPPFLPLIAGEFQFKTNLHKISQNTANKRRYLSASQTRIAIAQQSWHSRWSFCVRDEDNWLMMLRQQQVALNMVDCKSVLSISQFYKTDMAISQDSSSSCATPPVARVHGPSARLIKFPRIKTRSECENLKDVILRFHFSRIISTTCC